MLARLATVVATTAALTVVAVTPADAVLNGCLAEALAANTSMTCAFYGQPGYYEMDLMSRARYSWAQASCSQGGSLYVNVWDYEGGHDWTGGTLGGGVCTVSVSVGAGGTAWALAQRL